MLYSAIHIYEFLIHWTLIIYNVMFVLLQYLDKIGQVFFGLPPKPSNRGMMGGILGDIMQSLLEEGGASASASSPTLLASEEVD